MQPVIINVKITCGCGQVKVYQVPVEENRIVTCSHCGKTFEVIYDLHKFVVKPYTGPIGFRLKS